MTRPTPLFELIEVQASEDLIRAYIIQGATDSFGLSESWNEELLETYASEEEDIEISDLVNDMSLEELVSFLGDEAPQRFYLWPRNNEEEIDDPENTPDLYTNIVQCSFDQGGLIVLESYGEQILTLFTARGTVLSAPCHDLHLGENGVVMYRSAGRDPFFHVARFDGEGLEEVAVFSPGQSGDALFPDIGLRDLIPIQDGFAAFDLEMFDPHLDDTSIERCLEAQPGCWRHLTPMVSGLELAERIVTAEVTAFTLLQDSLRNDLQLVRALMVNLTEADAKALFHFLSPQQRVARAVAHRALQWGTPFVHHIGTLDDGDFIKEFAIRDHDVLIAASQSLTSDPQFMLDICQKNLKALRFASASLLSDMPMIQQIVNSQPTEVSLEDVLNDLLNHAQHGAAILPHMPPPANIQNCIQLLKLTMQANGNDHAALLTALDHIPDSFKDDAAFWGMLQSLTPDIEQRAQWILGLLPEQWLTDPNRVDELVQKIPELIFELPDELKDNLERFMRTLPKLKWHAESIRTHIVQFNWHQNPVVMHAAIQLHRETLEIADSSLLDDLDFMVSCIEPTYGWCFRYASERLRHNPEFANQVYQHNSRVREDFPPELLASGNYPAPQSDFLNF